MSWKDATVETALLACLQFDIKWEDKEANFRTVTRLVEEAQLPAGSLLALPEMFATGFSMNASSIQESAGSGSTFSFLSQLAQTHQLFIVAGVVVSHPDGLSKPTNEAVVYNPEGELIARYAKMHPFADERYHYSVGSGVVRFNWLGLQVAPFVCYDLRFPEVFRKAERLGVDIIVTIASWPLTPRVHHWTILNQARSIEGQCYVLACNRCGNDPTFSYLGRSAIMDHAGVIQVDAETRSTVITAKMDLATMRDYRQKLAFLKDMRADILP